MSDSGLLFDLSTINEYAFEIRFKPNSKVLDHRGKLADTFSSALNMPHWRITENRIDVYDQAKLEDSMEMGFISFRNAGYLFRNCPSGNQFIDKSKEVLRYIYDRVGVFEKKIKLERIGVRARFGNKFNGTFTALLNLYLSNYLQPNNNINAVFDGDIIDVGGHLNFKAKSGEFEMNTMAGPMEGEQLKHFFPFVDALPERILYFEIDSFDRPNTELDFFKLENILERLIRNSWSVNNKVVKLIAGN